MKILSDYSGLEAAVIGISCRVPGAADKDEFWMNLLNNTETISFFSENELRKSGVPSELIKDHNYVPAKGVITEIDCFDADFFGYTVSEADYMDPQVRIMHEEVFHALEDSGYTSPDCNESIGLFVGASNHFEWEYNSLNKSYLNDGMQVATVQLNDKDFIATHISYSLNLNGPSMSMNCACSTSLYAVDIAYRHLITGACTIAVAGGSSITVPNKAGYLTSSAGVYSDDGHCRPFDNGATGVVAGNGVAVVVLKMLDEAVKDGDRIYGIIRGSACNNDGSRKVGFTAPSVTGQAEVIKKAHRMAGVTPASISYIETHGTGTNIGDPIEMEAIKQTYGERRPTPLGMGSVKSNIGHLDVASGAISLIKSALILSNKMIPATLHFKEFNANIDCDRESYSIVARNSPLVRNVSDFTENCYDPYRIGVSAFGVGGTNVHMILEEAPERAASGEGRSWSTLCLSAESEESLKQLKKNYGARLTRLEEEHKLDQNYLWDLAWSLHTRQRRMRFRYSVPFHTPADLIEQMIRSVDDGDSSIGHSCKGSSGEVKIFFMFPGHGSQYAGMAKDLYYSEVVYQKQLDQCLELVEKEKGPDLRKMLLDPEPADEERISEPDISQLTLFIVEYSLARLLMHWGINPAGMIGHSLGEYTAACIAGVFTIEEGIRLVLHRGRLMKEMPPGSMLSVNVSAADMEPYLNDKLSVATINTPNKCTISGQGEAIDQLQQRLLEDNILCIKMKTTHGAHSYLMEGAVGPYRNVFKDICLKEPQIPFISNVSGTWIKAKEAQNADYYGRHLRSCVRFAEGIETIMSYHNAVLIEVGPRKVLSAFAIQTAGDAPVEVINMLREKEETYPDNQYMAMRLGELWNYGVKINWKHFYENQQRNFVTLVPYPFKKTSFWMPDIRIIQEKVEETSSNLGYTNTDTDKIAKTALEKKTTVNDNLKNLMLNIWKNLFGREDIVLDSDFFRLGGDSFKIMQLAALLEKKGYSIIMNDVYEYPTIRLLSDYLNRKNISRGDECFIRQLNEKYTSRCVMIQIKDLEEKKILFVDGDKDFCKEVRRYMSNLEGLYDELPDYIFPKDQRSKLPDGFTLSDLVKAGFVSDSGEQIINSLEVQLTDMQQQFNQQICKAPIIKQYEISKVQQMFLNLKNRLQLYSIELHEIVDVEILAMAIADLIENNGLLRSSLTKSLGKLKWTEYAAPTKITLPIIDLTYMTESVKQKVMDSIVKTVWSLEQTYYNCLMYHVILIKWSEKHSELFFQFDHSIVDMFSGQIIRNNLLRCYQKLKAGKRSQMKFSCGYDEFLTQMNKGPVQITEKDLLERLQLKEIMKYKKLMGKKIKGYYPQVKKIQFDVDMSGDELDLNYQIKLEMAVSIYANCISKLLNMDKVPIDLIYSGREYEGKEYNRLVGPTINIVSLLIEEGLMEPDRCSEYLKEKLQLHRDHNINLMNIKWNLKTIAKWKRIPYYLWLSGIKSSGQAVLNYVGAVEKEYEEVFNRTFGVLDVETEPISENNNFYALVKYYEKQFRFTIFCRTKYSAEEITDIFHKESKNLTNNYLRKVSVERGGKRDAEDKQ